MSQTKLASLAESWANIAIGFTINYFANLIILPLVGLPTPTATKNLVIVCCFTSISLARSYILRRYFNGVSQR